MALKTLYLPPADKYNYRRNLALGKLERLFCGCYLVVGNCIIHNEEGERKRRLESIVHSIKN